MWNIGLVETQAVIKITGININTYEAEDVFFVVQGEMEYGDSLEE